MVDRVADNIKRIVGIDNKKSNVLGEAEEKEAIPGRRGASFTAAGTSGVSGSTSASGLAGDDLSSTAAFNQAASFTGNTQPASLATSGGLVDPNDPSRAVVDGEGNAVSIDNILDGSGPSAIDPSNEIGEALDSITGMTDCATGKDICLHFKTGLIPPDGWSDIDEPPDSFYNEDLTATGGGPALWEWESGTRWVTTLAGTVTDVFFHTAGECIDYIIANSSASGTLTSISWDSGSEEFDVTWSSPNFVERCRLNSCTEGVDSFCPLTEPNIDLPDWPEDGCHQLAWEDGKFQGSSMEPDGDKITRLTSNNISKLDFCFGGGRFGTIQTASNGGFMIYETDSQGGSFSGNGMLYNRNGQAVATITDANEITQYGF